MQNFHFQYLWVEKKLCEWRHRLFTLTFDKQFLLPFHKPLVALKKKKTFNFSFCKSFVDFVATIMKIMLFSLRARRCEYFDTKVYSNTKAKRNKQREKQEFCSKPKNSKTAKIMSWIKELLAQLLLSTLAYINEKLKIKLK